MADPQIVLTDTPPLPVDPKCPRCKSDDRVLSCGFGEPHDVCKVCGHQFKERTV